MTLLGALTTLFQSSAGLTTAMPGSPWLDEPIEGTALPYAVVTGVAEEASPLDFEREGEVRSHFTFVIYGTGEATVEAFAQTVDRLLNWSETGSQAMVIAGRTLLAVNRLKYTIELSKTRNTQAARVTVATLAYEALWEELIP